MGSRRGRVIAWLSGVAAVLVFLIGAVAFRLPECRFLSSDNENGETLRAQRAELRLRLFELQLSLKHEKQRYDRGPPLQPGVPLRSTPVEEIEKDIRETEIRIAEITKRIRRE